VSRPFYLALIQSKSPYAAAAWWNSAGGSCESSLENFNKLGAATVTGVSKIASKNDTLQEADQLPLDTIVIIRRLRLYLQAITCGGHFEELTQEVYQKLILYMRIFSGFDEATPPLARTNNDIHIEHYCAVSASTSAPRSLATSEPRLSPKRNSEHASRG
jgi:hypothetical protein